MVLYCDSKPFKIMRKLSLLLLVSIPFLSFSQNCNCKKVLNNYTGDVSVKPNDDLCLTGTFSGNVEMKGGKLTVCGNANIGTVNFRGSALISFSIGAIGKIQSINSVDETYITNYCDSLVIAGGNFNQPFRLENYGKCRLNGGAFNSTLDIKNSDTMIVNTSLVLNRNCTFTNSKYFEVNGNLTPNSGVLTFNNYCQLKINGDMTLNGQDLNISGGYLRVNNVNINSGSIILNEASVFYVNSINIGGVIEGRGSRSTMVCTQNPNLNKQPSIKGNLSVCVKTGNFNPNPGTIEAPATVDCNNPIGGSECNPEPFGYEYYRMKPQTSNDWNNSATWEQWNGSVWTAPPAGKYPGKGASVLIGDGKTMTLTYNTEVSRLVLGEAGNGMLICDPVSGPSLTVRDTMECKQQSSVVLNKSTVTIGGRLLTDFRCKGGIGANLVIDVQKIQKNLIMLKTANDTGNVLNSLSYNMHGGTLSLSDTLKILNLMYPMGGTLNTNGKLVLLSTALKTASVMEGSGAYITGSVNVERYIPSIARRFRFVSPTVKNANLLQWQDDIYITGNNAAGTATGQQIGTLNSAGFDATQSFEPSMYFYNETKPGNQNNGWVAATNETPTLADYPLPVGKGYRLFIRGDRSDTNRLNGNNNTQNEVTMDMYGELVTGDVTVPITYTNTTLNSEDGWNLIGNPYASAYDWKTFYKENGLGSNFEPSVWVYDSKTNAYISYNVLSEAGSFTNGIIPSGQSFWVKANVPSGSITLKEKYKVESVQNDALRSVTVDPVTDNLISIRLVKDSVNADEVNIKFINGTTKGVDSLDIDKFWSDQVGIAQYVAIRNAYLDLSCRPLEFGKTDSIPLYYFVKENGTYTFNMSLTTDLTNTGAKAYLYDVQENILVDITTQPLYTFTVNLLNPANGENNRFVLIYIPDTQGTAIVNYQYAEKVDTMGVNVSWGSLSEAYATMYTIQRGFDSTTFMTIDTVYGTGSYGINADYELLDSVSLNDLRKDLYYRIGIRDSVNGITYNPIMYVKAGITAIKEETVLLKDQLVVYPVPSSDKLTLEYRNHAIKGEVHVVVSDITGKQVLTRNLRPDGNKMQLDISELNNGLYFMTITHPEARGVKMKIVKN